jgi:hypothetical protein
VVDSAAGRTIVRNTIPALAVLSTAFSSAAQEQLPLARSIPDSAHVVIE